MLHMFGFQKMVDGRMTKGKTGKWAGIYGRLR